MRPARRLTPRQYLAPGLMALSLLICVGATLSARPVLAGDPHYNPEPDIYVLITSPSDEEEKIWAVGSAHWLVCIAADTDTCKDDPAKTKDDSVTCWWTGAGDFPNGNYGPSVYYTAPPVAGSVEITAHADDDYAPENNEFVADDPASSDSVMVYIVSAEIWINDTPPQAMDDMVQVKNEHPSQRFTVPCCARVLGNPPSSVDATLTNPDGRLRFPGASDTEKTISLPADGSWESFSISGDEGSEAPDDAVIEANMDQDLLGAEDATVIWFAGDGVAISVVPVEYEILNCWYTNHLAPPAALFCGDALVQPAGLDYLNAPQISGLLVGFMQQVNSFSVTRVFEGPYVVWRDEAEPGDWVAVPYTMAVEQTVSHCIPLPVPDADPVAPPPPLYSRATEALKQPRGMPAGGTISSNDTPRYAMPEGVWDSCYKDGRNIATVSWSRRKIVVNISFTLFVVIYNSTTNDYCALRQQNWYLNLDSENGPHFGTRDDDDRTATEDPATGPAFNNVPKEQHEQGGGEQVYFTYEG